MRSTADAATARRTIINLADRPSTARPRRRHAPCHGMATTITTIITSSPRPEHVPTASSTLETRVLAKNDALAARNRAWFAGREILALNLVSSPGAGKTTLLERTIRDLRGELPHLR